MEDGPPIESPQEFIEANKDRPGRWICSTALMAIAGIYEVDIAVPKENEADEYPIKTWFKQEKQIEETMTLLLEKQNPDS